LADKVRQMEEMFAKFQLGQINPGNFSQQLQELNEAKE